MSHGAHHGPHRGETPDAPHATPQSCLLSITWRPYLHCNQWHLLIPAIKSQGRNNFSPSPACVRQRDLQSVGRGQRRIPNPEAVGQSPLGQDRDESLWVLVWTQGHVVAFSDGLCVCCVAAVWLLCGVRWNLGTTWPLPLSIQEYFLSPRDSGSMREPQAWLRHLRQSASLTSTRVATQ